MTIINKEFQGRIIGYARVSTRDQNLDMQLDVLQRQDCVQIFCEKISGVKKRPELEHCLSLLREGDVLVVYKLDRLARSLSEIVRICSELESKNIRVRSRIILIRPIIWGNLRCIFLRLWQNSNGM